MLYIQACVSNLFRFKRSNLQTSENVLHSYDVFTGFFIFSCLSFNDVPSYRDCFLLNLPSPNADYAIGVKQADDKSVYSV